MLTRTRSLFCWLSCILNKEVDLEPIKTIGIVIEKMERDSRTPQNDTYRLFKLFQWIFNILRPIQIHKHINHLHWLAVNKISCALPAANLVSPLDINIRIDIRTFCLCNISIDPYREFWAEACWVDDRLFLRADLHQNHQNTGYPVGHSDFLHANTRWWERLLHAMWVLNQKSMMEILNF
jgi:hypothetical protein